MKASRQSYETPKETEVKPQSEVFYLILVLVPLLVGLATFHYW